MSASVLTWNFDIHKSELALAGPLTLKNLPLQITVENPKLISELTINLAKVTELDTSGVNALLNNLQKLEINTKQVIFQTCSSEQERIIQIVQERSEFLEQTQLIPKKFRTDFLIWIGKSSYRASQTALEYTSLIGELFMTAASYIAHPSRLRIREVFNQLEQTGIQAIPVVLLVNFLIGIVMAYLLAMQAEKFGASIFVIDGVAIAMSREMSPILVAIILAGRSGSAFTAQLGAMKLTEEIDALKSIGLKAFDVLIFPRILSLLICLPLLVFLGELIGIYGGMLITEYYLGLTSTTFFNRLEQVLTFKHVAVGLIKAPVFALAIGMIACRVGLGVSKDARSVGLATTATVVQSIVIVILLNAAFAIVFAELGI